MEQIELIAQKSGPSAHGELEAATNKWLKQNPGKQIIDISLTWHPSHEKNATGAAAGWIILIRYETREATP